jgi:hypothetical protein
MHGLFDTFIINRIHTPEIAAGDVDLFLLCFSKGIKWKKLIVNLAIANQNRFLHLILSEARSLHQFKEVRAYSTPDGASAEMTHATAVELRYMMSSEQGLEWLSMVDMRVLFGVLSTLPQGLRANRIGGLWLVNLDILDRVRIVMADDEIMIDNEQNSEGEVRLPTL